MVKIIEETYKWARTNFTTQKPNTIDIHHALSPNCTAQDVHRWHLDKGWKGIAYHYFIRKDGSVYRGRQENHVGGGLLGSENKNKIEICLEGCYTDYVDKNGKVLTEKTVPEAQLTALIWLCNDIKTRWDIKSIKKHADYPSAKLEGKDCPGKYFPWNQFIAQMGESMNLIKFQTAAKYIGVYNDKVDNKAGPKTKAAAEEFLKITLQILGLQDPRELQAENAQLSNDMRLIQGIVEKYKMEG